VFLERGLVGESEGRRERGLGLGIVSA